MSMYKTPCMHEPLSAVVQRCCDARNRIFLDIAKSLRLPSPDNPAMDANRLADLLAKAGEDYDTRNAASAAYRYAMPDISTRQGIKDYIACVLHGMTVDAINHKDGARLLAGARIALAAHRGRRGKGAEKANTSGHPQIPSQPAA
ncbi:hypothetical protein [Terracidiphilus gabretensis]|uniref:hypothetical protein n=1 Tax=Terracidiphilus gabretensis TaxID=1577687 RepID=UPI0012FBFBD9|nr:hypothetical protein [Terracidiphilus gabretensis]